MSEKKKSISLNINGKGYSYVVDIGKTLLEVIRDDAGLKGSKCGCNSGQCGACTVLLNGKPVNSCCVLAVQADGSDVRTIEGESGMSDLSVLQEAFITENAIQCGFCTPGMIMSARSLLDASPMPSDFDIDKAMSGNLCRCTGYVNIKNAIKHAAEEERSDQRG